jgi:sugar phosphate isomerase/epimerase
MTNTKPGSRRNFLQKSVLLSGMALLPIPSFAMKDRKNYKMGLQLFTIRDAMASDPVVSLKNVRELGYEDLEIYGYDPDKNTYYGLKAPEFKKLLTDLDLTVSSGHYDFSSYFDKPADELHRFIEQCIEGSLTIESRYITWPWLAPEFRTMDNFKRLSEKLNGIGEQVNAAGLGFAYHNHDFEFTDHNGQIGYDIILSETDPALVKLQMDLYWVMHSSKKSPAQWIAQQPGRYVMWHIKDMDTITRDYTELGNGSINYITMLSTLPQDDLEYYYLEQGGNFADNSMKSITDSAAYFK